MAAVLLSLFVALVLITFFSFVFLLLRLSVTERDKVKARELRQLAEMQACARDKLYAEAKILLERAKAADLVATRANTEAAYLFKRAYNRYRSVAEIDLRELLIDEAIAFLQERLKLAKQYNVRRLTIVLGRRDAERDFKHRLRPVVEEQLERLHLSCTKFFPFDGRLYVELVNYDNISDTNNGNSSKTRR